MTPEEYPTHVQVVGWLFLGMGLLVLAGGTLVLLLYGSLGAIGTLVTLTQKGSGNPFGCFGCLGCAAIVVATALSLPGILAGIGLLARKTWGQMLAILVAAINLINFPVGTLIGGYALWVLTHEHAATFFGRRSGPA